MSENLEKTEDGAYKIGDVTLSKDQAAALRDQFRSDAIKEVAGQFETVVQKGLEPFKENMNWKEKISHIGNQIELMNTELKSFKTTGKPPKAEPTALDIEKQLAEMKAKQEQEMQVEREKMFKETTAEKIKAALIQKGLKEQYQPIVDSIINQQFEIVNDNGNPLFKNKAGDMEILSGSFAERAAEIAERFPDIVQTPKSGWPDQQLSAMPDEDLSKLSYRERGLMAIRAGALKPS